MSRKAADDAGTHAPAGYSRITIRETSDGLGIYNPARRNMPVVAFMLLWLGGWSVGEYFAVREIIRGENLFASGFLLIWVTFWTLGGAFIWWMVLWNLFGSERLFVTGGAVVRSVGLGPLRWRRVFDRREVSNLRLLPESSGANASGAGRIAFDAAGRERSFGVSMSEDELQRSLEAIRRALPQIVTKSR